MLEALTVPEIVRRLVIAANQGESPGSYRLNLALKEAEAIRRELREQEMETTHAHYQAEMAGE